MKFYVVPFFYEFQLLFTGGGRK